MTFRIKDYDGHNRVPVNRIAKDEPDEPGRVSTLTRDEAYFKHGWARPPRFYVQQNYQGFLTGNTFVQYVDPDYGDDSNPGTVEGVPKKTIDNAWNNCILAGNTYDRYVIVCAAATFNNDNSNPYVRFDGLPGKEVVVLGGEIAGERTKFHRTISQNHIFRFSAAHTVKIIGCDIERDDGAASSGWSNYAGIFYAEADNAVIEVSNCRINPNGVHLAVIYSADNVHYTFNYCTIELGNTSSAANIDSSYYSSSNPRFDYVDCVLTLVSDVLGLGAGANYFTRGVYPANFWDLNAPASTTDLVEGDAIVDPGTYILTDGPAGYDTAGLWGDMPGVWGGEYSWDENHVVPIEPPTADAGEDQVVTDIGNTGSVLVTLNGSGSTPGGSTINSYAWTWAGGSAAGVSPQVTITEDTTITLTVTTAAGGQDTDTVVINYNAQPVAVPGDDQLVEVTTAPADVDLDGSGSYDGDGTVVSYNWSWDDNGPQTTTGQTPTVSLPEGVTTISLTVTDDLGASSDPVTVDITVVVNDPGAVVPVTMIAQTTAPSASDGTVQQVDDYTIRTGNSSYLGGYASLGRAPAAGGKWQFEVTMVDLEGPYPGGARMGLSKAAPLTGRGLVDNNNNHTTWGDYHVNITDSSMTSGTISNSPPVAWAQGVTATFACDFDNNKIEIYVNGQKVSGQWDIIGSTSVPWYPACGDGFAGYWYELFYNFGQQSLQYPVAGYNNWNNSAGAAFTPDLDQYTTVYYVDINGNDSTGNGSEGNPWRTIRYAIAQCSTSGSQAIKVGAGTFVEGSNYYYSNRSVCIDVRKNVDIIGEPGQTIVQCSNTNPAPYSIFCGANHTSSAYRANFYHLILDIGNAAWFGVIGSLYFGSYQNNTRAGWYNCAFKGTANERIQYSNGGQADIVNCSFDLAAYALHTNAYVYPWTYTNCALDANNSFSHGDQVTCVDDATFDASWNITSGTWIDVGTGLDADDGTQADLGVYGGDYPW
jgi:hypothetical protein